MKRSTIGIPLIALLILASCGPEREAAIVYPPAPPADSIQSFLPGIVCTGGDSIDFNAAYSPDGRSFYFTRSINRKWTMYRTTVQGETWSKPEAAGFQNDDYSEADPAFGPDGRLYFISDRPSNATDTTRDFDIWYAQPMPDGSWSEPVNVVGVNSDSTEYYVSFTGNGDMYFASSRAGGFGQEDIYVSRYINGEYTTPQNLGAAINSPESDHDPALPADGAFIIYTSVDRIGGFGEGDLYYSIRDDSGHWSAGVPMDKRFNTSTYEYCSYFSPDSRFFFFSSRGDVMWTHVQTLPVELRERIHSGTEDGPQK